MTDFYLNGQKNAGKVTKRSKQQERFVVRRPCVNIIRQMIALKQLKRYPFIYWTCAPDMGKLPQHVAYQMKLDGYEKGNFDMVIVAADAVHCRVWLIEFKYDKGRYTPEQAAIAKACENGFVESLIIRTPEAFINFLEDELS